MNNFTEVKNAWLRLSLKTKMTVGFVISLLILLVFVFPYTAGYSFSRNSIATQMATLYKWENGEWMFGYAVVPLILGLAILKFDEIRAVEIKGSYGGLIVILFSLLLYFIGYKANNRYFGFMGIQLLVMGFIHFYMGWKMFWQLKWLWCLLAMVWPLIFLIDLISFPLQMIVTKITSGFLNMIGVDTVQNGTSLLSAASDTQAQGEAFSLKVAAACSGIRSLFALVLIGIAYSYLAMKTDLQRLLLIACILPLVIIGNFFRMNLLLIGVAFFGSKFAIGESETDPSGYHIGAGLLVYIFTLLGLMLVSRWIQGEIKLFRRKKTINRSVR